MLYLSKHFHKKIRQHAIVIEMTTLYLLILENFLHKVILHYCFVLQRLLISKAKFMLLIR